MTGVQTCALPIYRRVDLPTLGKRTVELAVQAHLAGIVYEAGGALFDDFEAVVALAEEQGLFLVGLAPADISGEA